MNVQFRNDTDLETNSGAIASSTVSEVSLQLHSASGTDSPLRRTTGSNCGLSHFLFGDCIGRNQRLRRRRMHLLSDPLRLRVRIFPYAVAAVSGG
jgi:hypothetical protein